MQKQRKVVFANIYEKSQISNYRASCGPGKWLQKFLKICQKLFFIKWNTTDIGLNQNLEFQKIMGGLMHPTRECIKQPLTLL